MIAHVQYLAAGVLAADVDPVTGRDPEWGKAAPAGLLIWIFLGAALFLLIKSMNRHMRRVPKSFDTAADGASDVADTAGDGKGETPAGPSVDAAEPVDAEEAPEPSS